MVGILMALQTREPGAAAETEAVPAADVEYGNTSSPVFRTAFLENFCGFVVKALRKSGFNGKIF